MMIFHYVLLFLLFITVHGEDVSNLSTLQLQSMVIAPYQRAFTVFESDIVDKLTKVNLTHVDRLFPNFAHELHCTLEEIQLGLQQTALNNQILSTQATTYIDELLESISRFQNETERAEILMNELNTTVDAARELVDVKEEAATRATRFFSEVVRGLQYFRSRKNSPFGDYNGYGFSNRRNDQNPFSFFGHSSGTRCHFGINRDPSYQSSAEEMHKANDELKKQRQHLKEQMAKYNATELRLTKISQQLLKVNTTLQQQQTISAVTTALNVHFELILARLKTVSTSSKRLLDVLMYVLDYETIAKPLSSIDEKLLGEDIVESTNSTLSKETMEKARQKLLLLSAKLPKIRHRRKQFNQPCTYRNLSLQNK